VKSVTGNIHFWTLRDTSAAATWDPDAEPDLHLSGYGHSFLELYARLRLAGKHVSIGRWPPRGTRVAVANLEELAKWTPSILPRARLGLALAALRTGSIAVIRNDLPLDIVMPDFVALEFMPTRAAIADRPRQVSLPLLPQRGLIPRDPTRGDRVEIAALKSYSFNSPSWLLSPELEHQLKDLGVTLRFDSEKDSPNRWHDFADVDVALCLQPRPQGELDPDYRRKPATKLINAWRAGAIPLVSPDAGYLELLDAHGGAIVVNSSDEVIEALRHLRSDERSARDLRADGRKAAAQFTPERVLDEWSAALLSAPDSSRLAAAAAIYRTAPAVVTERLRSRLRRQRS
jgi:glycosyltransferase involved in cell wall biosynthesis